MRRRRTRLIGVAALLVAVAPALDAAPPALAKPRREAPPPRPAATAPVPNVAAFTVGIEGDAFAAALADGLRTETGGDPTTPILSQTRDGLGLTADRGGDAMAAAKALLAQHIDAAVLMLGGDDLRPLPDGADTVDPGNERWQTLYGERVSALLALFQARGVPVIWVGLPVIADDQDGSGYAERNEIARTRVTKAGGVYVDSWSAFADENGRFDASGPDKDGRVVRLRAADGRGFTPAGAVKLATFVEADLRRIRAAMPAPAVPTPVVTLPREPEVETDINAEIRRDLGLPSLGGGTGTADRRSAPVIVTAPPSAPDGALLAASIGPPPVTGTAASLAQRALMEGRPIAPHPGRIDDFTWPRR